MRGVLYLAAREIWSLVAARVQLRAGLTELIGPVFWILWLEGWMAGSGVQKSSARSAVYLALLLGYCSLCAIEGRADSHVTRQSTGQRAPR